jgi:hypothetical protein
MGIWRWCILAIFPIQIIYSLREQETLCMLSLGPSILVIAERESISSGTLFTLPIMSSSLTSMRAKYL